MAKADLSAACLRKLLSYDSASGLFHWIKKPSQATAIGQVAGNTTKLGYRRVRVLKQRYMAHRLAWLYVYGEWPDGEIDHINGVTDDNSIKNLRVLTRIENQRSQFDAQVNNQSGLRGVSKRVKGYVARILVDGVSKNLGTYAVAEDAHNAYWVAKVAIHNSVIDRLHATAAARDVDFHYREAA